MSRYLDPNLEYELKTKLNLQKDFLYVVYVDPHGHHRCVHKRHPSDTSVGEAVSLLNQCRRAWGEEGEYMSCRVS